MSYKVKVTKNFEKEAKPLLKKYPSLKEDLVKLIDALEKEPELGTPLGKNLYKIRIAISSKERGKSSGARVITLVIRADKNVYLVSVYDKSEYDTAEIEALLLILKQEGL